MTRSIKAAELARGMSLSVGFYGEFLRIASVHYTSARAHVAVSFEDGTHPQYHRADAVVEIRQ